MNDTTIQELVRPEVASRPFTEWQLDLTTALLVLTLLGRAWKAWKDAGGWRGIWKAVLFGSAATDAQDVAKQGKA